MSAELVKIVRDWGVVAGALLVAGPVAGAVASRLRTPSGLDDATPLTAASSIEGIVVGVAVLLIAVGYGAAVGRLVHLRMGLICTGLALTMSAWQFGGTEPLVRDAGGAGVLGRLAVEGAIFGALAIVACVGLVRFSKPIPQQSPSDSPKPLDWALGAIVCLVAGGLAAWLLARSPMQGQVYAAAVAAGVAGGAAGRSVAFRAPMLALLAGGLALAFVGPMVATMRVAPDALGMLYAGDWPAIGYITPFDWLAGVLIGAPLGEMWAHSMVDRQVPADPKVKIQPATTSG